MQEHVQWGAEGKNLKQTLPAEHRDAGLDLMTHEVMTPVETKSWILNRLSQPGAPQTFSETEPETNPANYRIVIRGENKKYMKVND